MKIRLSPELSYLIGMWCASPYPKGLGIRAGLEIQEIFVQKLLTLGIAKPDQISVRKDGVYVQQTRYRRFFKDVVEERLIRFKHLNDYAAAFWAGVFDVKGKINDKKFYLSQPTHEDRMHLELLGFRAKREKLGLRIQPAGMFALFIRFFTERFKDNADFQEVVRFARSANKHAG